MQVKKISLLLVALSCLSVSYAQNKPKIGFKAGLTLPTFTLPKNTGENVSNPSIYAGVVTNIGLTDIFYLQPGLMYVGKGAKYSYKDDMLDTHIKTIEKFRIHTIEFQLNAAIKLTSLRGGFLFNLGPYLGLAAGGHYNYDSTEQTRYTYSESRISKALEFGKGKPFKRTEIGLNVAIGYEWRSRISILGNYGYALQDIKNKEVDDFKSTHKIFSLGMGYFLK